MWSWTGFKVTGAAQLNSLMLHLFAVTPSDGSPGPPRLHCLPPWMGVFLNLQGWRIVGAEKHDQQRVRMRCAQRSCGFMGSVDDPSRGEENEVEYYEQKVHWWVLRIEWIYSVSSGSLPPPPQEHRILLHIKKRAILCVFVSADLDSSPFLSARSSPAETGEVDLRKEQRI